MIITDTLNGQTVEDVRRETDGSVTFYCDSGRTLTLFVCNGRIEAKPPGIVLPDQPNQAVQPSSRMRLLEAFQGFMINYAAYREDGSIDIVCEPLRHDREAYQKAHGHREVHLAHNKGLIDELPPVSAKISLEGLKVFGAFK